MRAYGVEAPWYEERSEDRNHTGARTTKKGPQIKYHRRARKRARAKAKKELDQA